MKLSSCCQADVAFLAKGARTPSTHDMIYVCKMCENRCSVEWYGGEKNDERYEAKYKCPHCEGVLYEGSMLKFVHPPRPTIECDNGCGEINFNRFPSCFEIKNKINEGQAV